MSYNGIGLSTPRGSATSGHVTKNLSYVKRKEPLRNNREEFSNESHARPINNDILNHNKKRLIESKLYELTEAMIEQGFDDEEIEMKINEKRLILEEEELYNGNVSKNNNKISSKSTDSHAISAAKEISNQRMKEALGIKENKESSEDNEKNEKNDKHYDKRSKPSNYD